MKTLLRILAALVVVVGQVSVEVRAQTLDPTFAAIDLKQPASINDGLQQPDGKIVTCGSFTQVGGQDAYGLARLNADGSLDQAFAAAAACQSIVSKVRLYPNGKLLLTGYSLQVGGKTIPTLARLNADGTLDASFSAGTGASATLTDLAIQPDGKVLLCGQFTSFNGVASTGLVRLNVDGSVDQAFSTALGNGFTYTNNSTTYPVQGPSLALQTDGKIVFGGYFSNYQGTGRTGVVRLNADGSLDTTFNPTFTNTQAFVYGVALDPRTNYVVVYASGSATPNSQSLVRLTTTGAYDTSFQNTTYFVCERGTKIFTVDATGRVLFAGCFANSYNGGNYYLLRLLATGEIDTQFAVQKQLDEYVNFVQPLADGTALIGGDFGRYGTTRNVNLVRLNASAQPVASFLPSLTRPGGISSLALQADGKVVIGGRFSQLNGVVANNVARLTSTGLSDPTFSLAGTDAQVAKVLVQASGRIVLGGNFQVVGGRLSPYVARLLADGTADNTFTTTFTPDTYNNENGGIRAIAEQPDGSLIVAGASIALSGYRGSLHRLLTTGAADGAYASKVGTAAYGSEIRDLSSQADGRHYVAGNFTTFNGQPGANLVRLQADGTRDNTFSAPALPYYVNKTLPLATGQVLVGSYAYDGTPSALLRLSTLGAVDATFAPAVVGNAYALARYANGRVLLGGYYLGGGNRRGALARFNPDGTFDATFGNVFPNTFSVSDLVLQPNEAILVAGSFTQVGNTNRAFLARLLAPNILSVSSQQAVATTQAWPVPAHDYLHVALDASAQPRTVALLDVAGRLVLSQPTPTASLTLPVAHLPAGIYLLRVDYAAGPITRRIVLQ